MRENLQCNCHICKIERNLVSLPTINNIPSSTQRILSLFFREMWMHHVVVLTALRFRAARVAVMQGLPLRRSQCKAQSIKSTSVGSLHEDNALVWPRVVDVHEFVPIPPYTSDP